LATTTRCGFVPILCAIWISHSIAHVTLQ
jgi:hypothetical protein